MERKDVIIEVTGVSSLGVTQLKETEVDASKRTSRKDKERTSSEKKPNSD